MIFTDAARASLIVFAAGSYHAVYAQETPPAPAAPPPVVVSPAQNVVIRSVTVDGARAIPADVVARAATGAIAGKPGTRENLRAASSVVRDLYRAKGFLLAQVVGIETDKDGVLRITVVEGTVTRIVIKGNKKTRAKTILSALSVQKGDVYQEKRVANDRNRVDRLGVFSEVSITAQVPGTPDETPLDPNANPNAATNTAQNGDIKTGSAAPSAGASGTIPSGQSAPVSAPPPLEIPEDVVGQVELVIRVKERPTINVAATVGYSDGAGAVGFADISEANVAGLAQRASVQWQRTSRGIVRPDGSVTNRDARAAFNVSYDAPPLGDNATGFGADVYQKNTVFLPFFSGDQNSIRSYERRNGATVRGVRTLGRNVSALLSYRHDDVGYDAIPNDRNLNPPFAELARAKASVAALGVGLIDDKRDRAENPRTGFLRSITYEQVASVFGGNRNFNQTTVDLRQYAPFKKPEPVGANRDASRTPIVAVRVLGGVSSGDVPLSEQYFLGGYELLRGYDLYSIRGTRMLMGTGELRLPLGAATQAVAFLDAGNAWPSGSRVSLTGVKVGAGAGLRFGSPIGPIRLDAAYGSRLRTYITLGQSF